MEHYMIEKLFVRAMLLVVVMAVFTTNLPQVAAQESVYPPGASIIFVVDQSGSMSQGPLADRETGRRGQPSDPDGLALLALNAGIEPIFQHIVLSEMERISVDLIEQEHQIGVVLFGGGLEPPSQSVEIAVPLTTVQVQRDAAGNVSSNIDGMLPKQVKNMGDTAFSSAFDAVCGMINCQQGAPAGRKQVVVLLTDGVPASDSIRYNENDPSGYFSQLNSRFRGLFSNSELWVIGLDRTNRFWDKHAGYWEQIAPGRTELLTHPNRISQLFREIAFQAIGEPLNDPRSCDGTSFFVEPYKASLSLILEYPDSNSKAQFILPSGETLTRDTPNVAAFSRSALSESYILTDPLPGEWKCQIIGTSVAPQFRDIQGVFRVTNLDVGHFKEVPSVCRDFNMAITYLDRNDRLIAELEEYPLKHTMTITIDGVPITRQLVAGNAERTIWHVDGMLTPGPTGGTYPLQIDVALATGSRSLIFQETNHTVELDPRLPCLSIVTPTDGGVSSMHEGLEPVGVTLEVLLRQGDQPAELAGVFREDLNTIVTGHLEGPNGLYRELSLAALPGEPGLFGVVLNDLPDSMAAGGIYTFTAQLEASTQKGENYILAPQTISFTRQPGTMWSAVQIAYRVGAFLAIVILFILIALFIWWICPPRPRGTLVIQKRVTGDAAAFRQWEDVLRFNLSGYRFFGLAVRRFCIPIKSKPIQSQTNIRKLCFKHAKQAREEGVHVTLHSPKRGANKREYTFTKHGQAREIPSDLRLLYEDFNKKR
jgi:hypothetical protein